MLPSPCDRIRVDLSAYVDATLPRKRWEQVSYHLAGCQRCRDEVAAISSVCNRLGACRNSAAPQDLTARLESIAGDHAAAPLYMAAGSGELPSARRRRHRRVAQGSVALLALMVSVVVLATLVAPEPLRLSEPVKAAREQYSMASSAISVNEAVGAMLLAFERGADLGESVTYEPRGTDGASTPVTAQQAAALLQRATDADLTYTGTQRVWVADGEGLFRSAEVRTVKAAGSGAQLEVFDARGDRFLSSFLPTIDGRQVEAPEGWTFTQSVGHELVGDRAAIRLQAVSDGRVVASWWVDDDTGLVLWSERYNTAGAVKLAVGYKHLTLGVAELDHDGLTQLLALEPASSSGRAGWCIGLPTCPQKVAGLPLVAFSTSEREGSRSINLVYSDGFETAVVGWTEGVLDGEVTALSDSAEGLPSVELWQCADAVIWVTTNGTAELMHRIAAELPGQEPYSRSLGEQIASGFKRLLPFG